MKRIPATIAAFVQSTFPLLAEWLRFPSFAGWVAVSFGIVLQRCLPWNDVFSSISYNEILCFAIVLLSGLTLLVSFPFFRLVCFTLVGLALASQSCSIQHTEYSDAATALEHNKPAFLSGRIESIPTLSYGEYCFTVRADSIFTSGHNGALREKAVTCFSFQKPPLWGAIEVKGTFRPPRPAENPGAYDDYLNTIANGIWGRFYIDTILQSGVENSLPNALSCFARTIVVDACKTIRNSDNRAVIMASFLNEKSDLSSTVRDIFYRAGIYHLLALSGFNIAILASALFAFLSLIPIGKAIKILVILLCIWFYYFFIGPIPSLFRAVVMTTIVLAAYLFQRKSYGLNSLGLAGMLWLFFSPDSLFTPSYQLSFSATLGLVVLYPILSRNFMIRKKNLLSRFVIKPLCSTLFVSIAAFVATAPVLLYHFGTFSLTGIVANLFAVALMSISMWFALAGFVMQLVFPSTVAPLMLASEAMVEVMIRLSGLVAEFPLSLARIPSLHPLIYAVYSLFFLGICLVKTEFAKRYCAWAGAVSAAMCAAIIMVQASSLAPGCTLFSIKKACVAGIRWPDGKLWLVGTGPEGASYSTFSRVIAPWMRQNFSRTIDAVLIVDDPCNEVQSLEPLLKYGGAKTVIALSGVKPLCPEFPLFLKEYNASVTAIDQKSVLFPSSHGICSFMPGYSMADGSTVHPVKLSVFNSSLIIPDTVLSAGNAGGAVSVVFSRNNHPVVKPTIPLSHPVYPMRYNVY